MNIRKLCQTALLLALCILSQFLKNFSAYITGSFINTVLAIAVLSCGLGSGSFISVITPLTSWWITGSPVMTAMPLIVPCVMCGNLLFVLSIWFFTRKGCESRRLIPGCVCGTFVKSIFMWLIITKIILALLGPKAALPAPALEMARISFSLTQLVTAAIGSILTVLITPVLKRAHIVK